MRTFHEVKVLGLKHCYRVGHCLLDQIQLTSVRQREEDDVRFSERKWHYNLMGKIDIPSKATLKFRTKRKPKTFRLIFITSSTNLIYLTRLCET